MYKREGPKSMLTSSKPGLSSYYLAIQASATSDLKQISERIIIMSTGMVLYNRHIYKRTDDV